MNRKDRFTLLFSIGFSLGMLIEVLIFSFALPVEEITGSRLFLPMQFIGSGLYGAICFGGVIVYDIEEWGLLRVTATHYLITLVSFLVTNAVLGWFPWKIMVFVLIFFTVGYFIIWLVMYLRWKHLVKKLNVELEEMRLLDKLKRSDPDGTGDLDE